jgi:glycosyltransferase involved in cell wall biosynthesis
MRFILASTFVPFINGGARFIVEWLEAKLVEHGHEVERFYLPFVETPDDLLRQVAALRLIDLSDAGDRLIAFRPPAHVLRHPHKILWFIHHIRAYYDLWDTEYGAAPTPQNQALRAALHRIDTTTIGEARKVYTNSKIVADRLKTFNGIDATPLYPPLLGPDPFQAGRFGDEIVAVCRMEPHKRQHLLVDAMAYTRTGVRLRLCGRASGEGYAQTLQQAIAASGQASRIVLDNRWISDVEKAERLSSALAVAYLPHDEDSYGYPSLEAARAGKAVLTTTDSGGVLELIIDQVNGFVCPPDARAIAARFDELYLDRERARQLGDANRARVRELKIDWDHVISALCE